jgi:hypothetical protein
MMYESQKIDEPAAWKVTYLLTGQYGDEEECELDSSQLIVELSVRDKFKCNPTLETAAADVEAFAAERAKSQRSQLCRPACPGLPETTPSRWRS